MKTDRRSKCSSLDDDYHDPDDNEDNSTYLSIQLHHHKQVQPQVTHYTPIEIYKHNRTQGGHSWSNENRPTKF
jgi:hypothetical protein